MRILIADDVASNRKVLGLMLSRFGRCEEVENGAEAVAAYRFALEDGDPYSLVCLDLLMPELSGRQAIADIRAYEQSRSAVQPVKIIFVTTLDNKQETRDLEKPGEVVCLEKPVAYNQLAAAMKNLGFEV